MRTNSSPLATVTGSPLNKTIENFAYAHSHVQTIRKEKFVIQTIMMTTSDITKTISRGALIMKCAACADR